MSSEGTLAVAAAVVALVQLGKWAGLKDSWGPLLVILLSGLGVMIWLVSGDSWPPARTDIWPVVTGWINVTLSAAGTFGFTRATASAVTRATAPPNDGAGSSATTQPPPPPVDAATATAEQIAAALERARVKRIDARLHEKADALTADQERTARAHAEGAHWPRLSDDEIVRRHEALG